ncbi:anti-sigma factor antagonist [Streptomyces minutiscleroticus]|uniref:Anti-sigma factor antagonist n=1 Tax=Streptomyces minutiscleroticus TaxID=68238 RepID=A0A918NQN6_9ACTN|nr:anti-sigma factor antagonist [Streptomyces minutiscleroticus]GGX87772.1 hypothetical protein GCM10010358_47270 [Streptomyces minutiscleroticus]
MRNDPAVRTPHLRIHQHNEYTVLEFHGEIDILAALETSPLLDAATGRPAPQIVIDLRNIEFLDCSGLRLLHRIRRRTLAQGGRVHLVCTHRLTLRVLQVTGLAAELPPLSSLDEAFSHPEATTEPL